MLAYRNYKKHKSSRIKNTPSNDFIFKVFREIFLRDQVFRGRISLRIPVLEQIFCFILKRSIILNKNFLKTFKNEQSASRKILATGGVRVYGKSM